MSSSEPIRPHRPHHLPTRARRALPTLLLLCTLTLSACGTSGTTSSEAASAPSAQETTPAPHSAAASPSGDGQKRSTAQTQIASGSSSLSAQATDGPTPTPAGTAPDRNKLLNASLSLPSTCTANGPVSFSGGQASLSFGGFARIEAPSATYILDGTPTAAVALTCNGGGSAAFPSLAFYDDELSLVASYDLSRISGAESYEPVITSLEPRGDILHVEWSNEKLPTDTAGMHTGSGTGSADLSWNGTSFDKSNTTVHDAQGNQVG